MLVSVLCWDVLYVQGVIGRQIMQRPSLDHRERPENVLLPFIEANVFKDRLYRSAANYRMDASGAWRERD